MAAITTTGDGRSAFHILRNATAQANTGQTDWVTTPSWAKYAQVYLNWSAMAGTTPLMDFKIHDADPVALNDTYKLDALGWNGITQLTTVPSPIIVQIGPGITGIADDDTGPFYSLNGPLPVLMGFQITLDRTTGDETYTYTLSVKFSK